VRVASPHKIFFSHLFLPLIPNLARVAIQKKEKWKEATTERRFEQIIEGKIKILLQ